MNLSGDFPRVVTLIITCVISLPGCGGSSQRKAIEGRVTLNNVPLAKGSISFQPQSGTASPSVGAEIVDGRFEIPDVRGPFVGKFRVEITASHPSGRKVADRFGGPPVDEIVQFLPHKYNTESELTAEVKPDGINHFDFPLATK